MKFGSIRFEQKLAKHHLRAPCGQSSNDVRDFYQSISWREKRGRMGRRAEVRSVPEVNQTSTRSADRIWARLASMTPQGEHSPLPYSLARWELYFASSARFLATKL